MIHNGTTLEDTNGLVYNIDWAIRGMNKFSPHSKEYKIFQSVFKYVANKNRQQQKVDLENNN